jgi:hypothetical protein
MARQGYFAYISPVGGRPGGGPVDPGYGVDEGVDPGWGYPGAPGHPDQGLPGGRPPHVGNRPPGSWGPEYPSTGPVRPGRPIDPGYEWGGWEHPSNRPPGSWGGRPDQGLPRPPLPPHVWPRPPGGGLPVDPGWGVGGAEHPEHGLPIYPVDPAHPDNSLPPVPGEPPPEVDPPPGTIWPPLPPEVPAGKAIALVAISGLGYRYAVIEIPENPPSLPPRPQPK